MPLDQESTRLILRKLSRQLGKLASKPAPENIHRFRTSSRRAEVLVADLAEERSRNDKKLMRLLGRLRKKAGRVRDLDVEIAALRSLKIPQEPLRKSQLMRTLA
jgi:CHAD domain-containing protein